MKSPVTMIFFNRPETLEKAFEQVKKAKPPILFLVQDGPREGNETDMAKILQCREIVSHVDWDCKAFTNYSDVNLGCGMRPQTGITWALSQCESTIILEDDCVADQSFFGYCDELLEKYKDDERVCYISGLNHFASSDCEYDYFFTKTGSINGWATWRRSWQQYDYYVHAIQDSLLISSLRGEFETKAAYLSRIQGWKKANESEFTGEKLSHWDIQWGFVKYSQSSYVIVPKINLITNIGYIGATHEMSDSQVFVRGKSFINIPRGTLNLPLKHPPFVICNHEYDRELEECMYKKSMIIRFKEIVKKLLHYQK